MSTYRSKGVAVLLLDAENIQLTVDIETFLQSRCSYPITCKIAFANWRALGNLDQLLHERGYDLIQVPGGKDAADGKMIAYGCQLREVQRKAKAVFVCSSDAVMVSLCNYLFQQELEVYRVVRQDGQIKVSKYPGGKVVTFSPRETNVTVADTPANNNGKENPASTSVNSTEKSPVDANRALIEQKLVKIIHEASTDKKTIELSKLGQEYIQRHGEAITKTLTRLKLGGDFKKFVSNSSCLKLEKVNKVLKVTLV